MKTRFTLIFIVALFYISAAVFAQTIYYVSPSGGNNSPYTSWADAATNIQDAVNVASDTDLILVDDGTYILSANITITKGVTVRSVNGYASSIVDGNNVTRCFYIDHADAVVDGFTIQNGYNPGGFGGNVNIVSGGTVQNSFITGGQARDGGGIAIDNNGLVYNSIITNNAADNNSSNGYGGGVRLLNGGTVRGSLIHGNTSQVYGGGVNIWNAGTVENCTLVDNTAPQGAGIRARNNSTIVNTIIYSNNGDNWQTSGSGFSFDYSCSTPALPAGTGNTTDDPLFVDESSDDYHLTSASTLINAGLNDAWMTGETDIDGNDRVLDGTVDIGAFEFASSVNIISDDFFPETSPQSFWTFVDPVGDVTLNLTGTNAEIEIPGGSDHDLWTGAGNRAARLLQDAPDTDFQIEVKFESVPSAQYQLQGIIVQEDNDTFIRFGSYYGGGPNLFVAVIDGSSLVQTPGVSAISSIPPYLRVTRTGSSWTYEYSSDGSSWNTAAAFTQAFTVNQVGFYGGNSGSNPPFTASADYFMSSADPITDTDTPSGTPPTIEFWYGDNQTFGNLGNPQQWVNILGRVSDDNGVASLSYKLNGGSAVPLTIGPNGTRLVGSGDFVTEIDRADLINGANLVEFTVTDALGAVTIDTVTINYQAGNVWPLPYTADWSALSDIEDINNVANIVDGIWELTPEGIRTTETGYDRLIVMGDETWTSNYEVTAEMTIHSGGSSSGVGFAIGWQGHTGSNSPRTDWPLEAIGWVRNFPSSPSLRILTYEGGIQAQQGISITAGTKYLLKARSEDIGGGLSRFSVKIWEDGTPEPGSYLITADIADRDGSVLFITHRADVTWGTVQIDPITGNQPPQFTSTPVTLAQVGQPYTYNITASDPNSSDVLTTSAPTLPGWLTFNDNGDGTATLSGTPGNPEIGTHNVELLVEDGNGEDDTQNFTIVVTATAGTLPISDQFCGPNIESFWTIYDPYDGGAGTQTGESSFGINNGALEISIPGNEGSHDLAQNLSPRLLQTVPDDDFGVEVKFNSVPSTQYQMQGIIVQGTGYRLRFETYYGTAPTFYANGYEVSFGSAVNQPIGGPIPAYLRVVRTGDSFAFDYSYDGTNWTNIVTRTIPVTVAQVGFYGANHTPNPAFTLSAEYFRNVNDPIPSCSLVEVTSPNGGESWTGNSTEQITWTSTDVTNVNIEFSSDNGNTWSTVATSVDASLGTYSFNVPNISSTECFVRISDTDDSNVNDISDATFTVQQFVPADPTIIISEETGVAGSYITVTVELSAPGGFSIDYLLQGKIHFDHSKLKFLYGDYDASSLLNNFDWTGVFYSALPGKVDVLLSGQTPINTSGVLFELTFQVIDHSAGSSALTGLTNEWIVDVLQKPLVIDNGSVTYSDPPAASDNRGDATLNFIVDIYDAIAVIYHWAGISLLNGQAFINADADFDGDVDIDDYLRIIFFVYLHDWDYSFPPVSPGSSITFNDASMTSEETVSIPFELANSENVQSLEVSFEYDSDKLEFLGFTSGTTDASYLRAVESDEGEVKIFGVNNDQLKNERIGEIRFKKKDVHATSNISANYKLNNGQLTDDLLLEIGEGTITSAGDNIDEVPDEFYLSQNYPNPFNPVTNIKFSVPQSGNYKLVVYNVLGREVMTLVDKNLQPGNYNAYFDGNRLSSGVYIYSLIGNNISITKKMLLIK